MLDKDIFIHKVPKGIRYISDWKEFEIFNFPHILDKQIPGCGFTEYCITNPENVILCSPRKILLKNKYDQHVDDVFLINVGEVKNVDLNLESTRTKGQKQLDLIYNTIDPAEFESEWRDIMVGLRRYISSRLFTAKPIKILVTYDSFRRLKDVLDDILSNQTYPSDRLKYRVVVDEFQSIFTDSRFKSSTEIEFLYHLQGIEKVCYVSATPMMKNYLSRLDEFKDLPFYELDWKSEDPGRVNKPNVSVRQLNGIKQLSKVLIDPYITGEYYKEFREDPKTGKIREFISKELIIYVNSVSNIISIIKACKLTSDKVNILCADTEKNRITVKELNYKATGLGKGFKIGQVPLRNEPRKTITLCTRTVYLGADFYSDNARSIVISDANIECMAVDITLDLPQILGRQRLDENPWKNEINLYVKCITPGNVQYVSEFNALRKSKRKATEDLLLIYRDTPVDRRDTYIKMLEFTVKALNFRENYVAVNNHAGSHKIPVENKLVQIAEERAFDIQQIEYSSRFLVFSTIKESLGLDSINDISSSKSSVDRFLNEYKKGETGSDRLKVVCTFKFYDNSDRQDAFLNYVPLSYRNYYYGLGPDRCKELSYNISRIKKELSLAYSTGNKIVFGEVVKSFKVSGKYSKSSTKSKLSEIYESISYDRKAKASDLSEWFDISPCKLKNSDSGKWEHGFEIKGIKK